MIEKRKRENLKNFRLKHDYTQVQLAEKLKISLIQYQFIELGHRNPSYNLMLEFKKLFPNESIEKIFLT